MMAAGIVEPATKALLRFGNTAKVLAKCMLKYYRISECDRCQPPSLEPASSNISSQKGTAFHPQEMLQADLIL